MDNYYYYYVLFSHIHLHKLQITSLLICIDSAHYLTFLGRNAFNLFIYLFIYFFIYSAGFYVVLFVHFYTHNTFNTLKINVIHK